jgi:hypothetical protein
MGKKNAISNFTLVLVFLSLSYIIQRKIKRKKNKFYYKRDERGATAKKEEER